MNAPEPSVRAYPNRTRADYANAVAARFGGELPDFADLARLESRAMRAKLHANHRSPNLIDRRKVALENPNCLAMLAGLASPMAVCDAAKAIGMPRTTARAVMQRLINAGLVRRHSINAQHATIWERCP